MKSLEDQLKEASKQEEIASKKRKELEQKLQQQKEAKKPKPIWETITSLAGIYKRLKCDPKKDVIKIDKFSKQEHAVLEGIVERMRIAKVYNDGKLPAKNQRWYPWFVRKNTKDNDPSSASSGLVFYRSDYGDDDAALSSASRLSFVGSKESDAYARNFKATEEKIIQL